MLRFLDILFSVIGIIILSPLLIIISLVVYFDSHGPVFYSQKRVGKNGYDFNLLKFRSMYIDSEKKGFITIGSKDPRITRAGYLLRKLKLDELPQLFNVIKGDMNFVGPRPEVRKYVDLYTEKQKEVLTVRPGITDYASIKFRNENELLSSKENPEEYYIRYILPKKIRLNMAFITNKTYCQYFIIIFLTFYTGILAFLKNIKGSSKNRVG